MNGKKIIIIIIIIIRTNLRNAIIIDTWVDLGEPEEFWTIILQAVPWIWPFIRIMATFQLKATEIYREIAQVPVATEGRIFRSSDGGLYEVEIKWSQKDLRRESRYNFAKSYLVRRDNKGLSLVTTSSFQRDISSV